MTVESKRERERERERGILLRQVWKWQEGR